MNTQVHSLTKPQLQKLLNTIEIGFNKKDSLGLLINKVREHLELSTIEDVIKIKKVKSVLFKPDYFKYEIWTGVYYINIYYNPINKYHEKNNI